MNLSFRSWLNENVGTGVPSSFINPDGTVTLYRYSKRDHGDSYLIDPNQTAGQTNSYSRNDYRVSNKPRTFFYLDIDEKEDVVGNYLYVAHFPADEIYNLLIDPLGLKKQAAHYNTYDFDKLFSLVEDAGFKGVYYKPGFHVVNLFVPVLGHAATEEEIRRKVA